MTVLRNNFNGGPAGTTLTTGNSGQFGDDPFDVVSIPAAGGVLQFTDAATLGRGTAQYVLQCSNGATASQEGGGWTTSMGTQTQIWWRMYIYSVALPSGALNPTIFECDNGAAFTGSLDVQVTTGKLRLWNGPATVSATSTNGLVAGAWARLEGRYQYSTTVGNADVQIYLSPDADLPDETISISGCNMGAANSNTFQFGYIFSRANQPTIYLSGLELNNTGFPGPAPFIRKGVPGIQPNPIAIHTDTW